MSNGNDIIKIFIIFVVIFSAVGLFLAVVDMSDIAVPDDPQNMIGQELGQNVEEIFRIAIGVILGSIFTGAIIYLLTGRR